MLNFDKLTNQEINTKIDFLPKTERQGIDSLSHHIEVRQTEKIFDDIMALFTISLIRINELERDLEKFKCHLEKKNKTS